MTDQTLILLSAGSILLGLLSAILFSFLLGYKKWWQKALVKAPVYGLLLGITISGGGNSDPGFALPVPIIPAFLAWDTNERLFNVILPFIYWTLAFFTYESIKYYLLLWKERHNKKPEQ